MLLKETTNLGNKMLNWLKRNNADKIESQEREIVDEFFRNIKEQDEFNDPIYDQVMHASFTFFHNRGFKDENLERLMRQVLYKVTDFEVAAHNLLLAYDAKFNPNRNDMKDKTPIDFNKEMQTYRRRSGIIKELMNKYFQ